MIKELGSLEYKNLVKEFFLSHPNKDVLLIEWDKNISFVKDKETKIEQKFKKFFKEQGVEFVVSSYEEDKKIEKINFEIGDEEGENLSEFTFVKDEIEIDGINKEVWNLEHRLSNAKNLNISGTDIYTWIEKYMKIMFENKKLEELPFCAEVYQPNVLKWFLKNGYNISEEDKNLLIQIEDSGDYTAIPVSFLNEDHLKDDFWIKKEMIEEKKLKKFNIKIKDENGIKMLIFNNEVNPSRLQLPIIKLIKKL